jgi:osmotically-inducible protein OsmY
VVTHDLKINATISGGVCTLQGDVDSRGEELLAERVVSGIVGVRQIDNQLKHAQISKIPDDVLRKEISDLLKFSVLLDNANITVRVKDGAVTLDGTVSNAYQRSQADQLAYRAGAKSVDARGIRIDSRHSDQDLRTRRYEQATDAEIQDIIGRSWNIDPRLVGFQPAVNVRQGVATLTGVVGDLDARLAAERAARYTIGVRRVDNQIKVEWPAETPGDEQIAIMVREALGRDPYVDVSNIKVDCEEAHVGLYGIVDSEFEKEHAGYMAGRQIGVVHVDNSLTVRKAWVHKTDEAIEKDLKERLAMIFLDEDNQVACKVTDGVALLEGSVDSWFMWQAAVDQAIAAGAREPHVMIDVRYGEANKTPYYGPFDYVPR